MLAGVVEPGGEVVEGFAAGDVMGEEGRKNFLKK